MKPKTQTRYELPETRARALLIDELLFEHYGGPFLFFSDKPPLSQMISALLSHRTKNAVSGQAYRRLEAHFADWNALRLARPEAVEPLIAEVTFPEVKAPRIIQALQWIYERNDGRLTLDFLGDMSVPDARRWLEQIPGVGAKTSAAILNFSRLRMPALVVDTHHQRVAQRLGLVPEKASIERASKLLMDFLPAEWDGQRVYDSHQGFMRHGQRVCHWRHPNCKVCVVREHCDHYAEIMDDTFASS